MFIKEYKNGEKNIGFRLTYKAKVEIEKWQIANAKITADDDVIKAMAIAEEMKDESKDFTLDQKIELAKTVTNASIKMNEIENSINSVDIVKILLLNDHKSGIKSNEEFNELLQEMDDDLGTVEMMKFFNEISDKVFMMLEEMKPRQRKVPQEVPVS